MKIRRILATAVAVAVTTPAVLLSVTPAFADTAPTAQTQAKPTLEELEKAAAEAQEAYDKALAAKTAAYQVVEDAMSDTAPLTVAANDAKKAADDAGAAKTAADQAVTNAKAALDALPETATKEERTAAETAVTGAEAIAATAAADKTAADTKAEEARDAADDARVAALRAYSVTQKALTEAKDAKTAADDALAKAREEEENENQDCVAEPGLTTVLTGVPDSITAGTTTSLSLRVSNRTGKTLEAVTAHAFTHATDKSGLKETDKLLHLQWSTASSPKWHSIGGDHLINGIGPLKNGAHADIKLRLTIDASAPAGNGAAFVSADYTNENGSCGGNPDIAMYDFGVDKAAKPKPGKTDSGTTGSGTGTGTTGTTGSGTTGTTRTSGGSGPSAQGTASSNPVTTGGSLASTGSSSATPQLALASGAAVALGAAAMFTVRRRRTGTQV
ncbi:peptidase [Streptomyces sp. SID11233]|nr:peptidase [Streptomyces sp. SID11233]